MKVTLYTGPHCELCDQAKELIYPFLQNGVLLKEVDVTQSLETKKAYGLRIPVLKRDSDGAELGWPFTNEQLHRLLLESKY